MVTQTEPVGSVVDGSLSPLPAATTRSDTVADSIRRAILSGRLRPGEVLVERRLAEALGVSKTPVREALIALTSSGLVTIARNRGVTVRRLEKEDLERVRQMRLLLEPWTTACAAERSGEYVPQARLALDEARERLTDGDHVGLSLANRRFHRSLYRECGNELIIAALDGLQDLTALGAVSLLWAATPSWADEYTQHQQILEAVEAGRAEEARELMLRHITQAATPETGGDGRACAIHG
ncbi:GntR family transcriptional regulator [Blastococcus sp. VKM Ac-2987]|uniref:GntR family transcriptional regulator n=1 Tax=Blastococcus sp. VKM Ac-2987 TaxID=3004141 RepID=UPI0022ABACA0|nr:GntR family transcriptional regulator [Blastococcus sp. VKM Ac-2987]MCZ2856927.1 GntR family transcriptional regulator [Blastococcus sp. VKM Ac-2987]